MLYNESESWHYGVRQTPKGGDVLKYGEKIKALRNEKGMTQEELAKELGVWLKTVQVWEWSRKMPKKENMEKIAGFLGSDVGTLFFDETDKLR